MISIYDKLYIKSLIGLKLVTNTSSFSITTKNYDFSGSSCSGSGFTVLFLFLLILTFDNSFILHNALISS